MDLLELSVDLAEGVIHILFLCLGLPQKERKWSWWISFVACIIAYTLSSYFITDNDYIPYAESIVVITRLFIISAILCNGFVFQKLTFCSLGNAITSVSGLLTATCVPVFLNTSIGITLHQDGSIIRIIAVVFAKSCQLILSLIVLCVLRKLKIETEKSIWAPMFLLILFSSSIVSLMSSYNRIENDTTKNVIFIVSMVLSVVESMVVFLIFTKILYNERENIRLSAFIEQIDREVDSVSENEKNLEEIRGLKHEIRNEYILVRELINNERLEEAVSKLTEIVNDAEQTFGKVFVFDSGSASVNAVLNYYIRNLQNIGLCVNYSIEKINVIKENEKSICSILLNLLKNVYENEMNIHKGNVDIELKNEMDYIKISIKNSIEKSVININSDLKTTKMDKKNHGFGIKSVKKIVKAQNGSLSISEKNGMFTVEVWLINQKMPS